MWREKYKSVKMDERYKQVVQNNKITVSKEIHGRKSVVIKEIKFIMFDKIVGLDHTKWSLVGNRACFI